ncbi:MAG: adenylyl-sulfate kinase [Bacillota bacterium]
MNGLLKFITCGSVDDGKSTLIGHMLYDAKLIFADQENALLLHSSVGSRENEIDYSLLLDGLMAEREQGITIDVAYRYFNTEKRSFIVADTPGHEEYTRNMAVGASFADLAIILLDASKGVLPQTKRHMIICHLMGIQHFLFAVNKMDLISYDEMKFKTIEKEILAFTEKIEYQGSMDTIPVSATEGDNITIRSENTAWYQGKTLLDYLETIDTKTEQTEQELILPVQRVSRPNLNFRGFQGQISQGAINVGDDVTILPSKEVAKVKGVLLTDKEVDYAMTNDCVTVSLDKEVDCSRGCVITKNENLHTSRLFRAKLLWTDDGDLVVGRNYLLKLGTKTIPATIINIHHYLNIHTGESMPKKKGSKNDIIECDISLSEKIVFCAFEKCQALGRFILIDRVTNMTSACGVVKHKLSRSDNLTWQNMDITREIRANQKNQMPKTIWFTGLSGSGKSTIANELEKALVSQGKHTMILDGDNVRIGLNNNLGFSETDRVENIRRIAETAKLMNDAGLIVLVSAISPFQKDRENAKKIIGDAFFEVYVKTSLEECEKRDTKGLYQKARAGQIGNFTGISSPYDVPEKPEFIAETEQDTVGEIVKKLLKNLY